MTSLRILYVDDDADIRTIVRLSLALDPGFDVRIATSGAEGLEMLAAPSKPDVVLLDVMMPGVDGLAVLDRMRANPATADIPVIFLTAKGRRGDVENYRAKGACGVILKPFDPVHLAADVRAILARDCSGDDGIVRPPSN